MESDQEYTNKGLVQKVDMAFATGDSGYILSHMHEDVVWEMLGEARYEGKKEVERIMAKMEKMPRPEILQARVTAEDDRVVAEGIINGKGKDGDPFRAAYCDSYLLEDRKIKELTTYVIDLKK